MKYNDLNKYEDITKEMIFDINYILEEEFGEENIYKWSLELANEEMLIKINFINSSEKYYLLLAGLLYEVH